MPNRKPVKRPRPSQAATPPTSPYGGNPYAGTGRPAGARTQPPSQANPTPGTRRANPAAGIMPTPARGTPTVGPRANAADPSLLKPAKKPKRSR